MHVRLRKVVICLSLSHMQMNIISGGFFDGLMLYAQALNESMTGGEDMPLAENVTKRMWNRTFHGEFCC